MFNSRLPRWLLLASLAGWSSLAPAQTSEAATERERQLMERIRALEERLAAVEARLGPPPAQAPALPQTAAAPANAAASGPQFSPTGDSPSLPGYAPGTTVNFLLDGYYEYNLNQPVGRVNLLRPFDPTANSFTLNQAGIMVERSADTSLGRRLGFRLDLMFGQTPEALSGSPANEPRTAPYRNIVQAYGTYVVPAGNGLNVDFGRFISTLGFEGPYVKDQVNYTRSFLFTALPAYHMGVRSTYKVNDRLTASWLLVNGANQMEDFNGFKSNDFMFSAALSKNLSWTGSYYVGRENRDLVEPAVISNLPPALATQPGLSVEPVVPRPNGRTHIADTYFTWNATPKLTLVAEGDYILSRLYSNSYPARVAGGAAYVKYQFVPSFSLAGRYEYVSDRGGYLSGITQRLQEATVSAAFQPAPGFQLRGEFRRDYSNQPFFLSEAPGVLKRAQNTVLIGVLWWFGGKQGAW